MDLNGLEFRRLDQLAAEINALKAQTAHGLIEIGQRLIEAKKLHKDDEGGFRRWCAAKCDFSKTTAYRFMRCAEQLGSVPTLGHLGVSKVYKLLEFPELDRLELVNNPQTIPSTGEVKTIADMTNRELAEVMKYRKQALAAEQKAAEADEKAEALEQMVHQLQIALDEEQRKPARVEYQTPPDVQAQLENVQAELAELKQRKKLTSEFEDKLRALYTEEANLLEAIRKLKEAKSDEELMAARAAQFTGLFRRSAKPLIEAKGQLEALAREGVIHWTAAKDLRSDLAVLYDLLEMVENALNTVNMINITDGGGQHERTSAV